MNHVKSALLSGHRPHHLTAAAPQQLAATASFHSTPSLQRKRKNQWHHPSVHDAQSIVGNLKEKLKESQYQITPWRAESSNNTSGPAQSPPPGNALVASSQPSLDIVPQQPYSHVQSPISSPVRARRDWDLLANDNRQVIPAEAAATNTEHGMLEVERPPLQAATEHGKAGCLTGSVFSCLCSNQITKDVSAQGTERDSRAVRFSFESEDQNPSFTDLVRSDASENLEGAETQASQEPPAEWGPEGGPSLASGPDDGNLPYPYLPTVLEEPSTSFSEEDDPLPAIDGLRITGEAFPGKELQASGYSINGTTSCNFEWVRHLEDGSVNYIEGIMFSHAARKLLLYFTFPTYLVTADDVDSLLAIEVQPLDDRKRKGEIVKVYANEQRKITCDPEMKELIKKILSVGHVSYEVLLPVRFIDMWEPAVLAIKREGYSIKCNGQRGVVIIEKFQQATALLMLYCIYLQINIPYGHPTEFSIQSADGAEYNLKPGDNSPSRDNIVLILRLFRMKANARSCLLDCMRNRHILPKSRRGSSSRQRKRELGPAAEEGAPTGGGTRGCSDRRRKRELLPAAAVDLLPAAAQEGARTGGGRGSSSRRRRWPSSRRRHKRVLGPAAEEGARTDGGGGPPPGGGTRGCSDRRRHKRVLGPAAEEGAPPGGGSGVDCIDLAERAERKKRYGRTWVQARACMNDTPDSCVPLSLAERAVFASAGPGREARAGNQTD
ncbi:hypothetical protein D1007_53114 [Hordeum vulgare]|nr:hypothetical protein D1007_53114 [Hordeum vulgare]